jgi:hypothetical protein
MEWLKLDLRTIRSPEYIGSEPVERATWINLLAYCADEENSGTITDCLNWPDRMWQQVCGVTKDETRLECALYTWEGDDLVVAFYPVKAEEIVQSRRDAGKAGADARWQKKDLPMAKKDCANTDQTRPEESIPYKSIPEEKPKASASGCGVLEWDEITGWMDFMNSGIPDRHRAEALAREFMDEMIRVKWLIQGEKVRNPMGLLVERLKKDGALRTKKP